MSVFIYNCNQMTRGVMAEMRAINPLKNNDGILLRFSYKGKRYSITPISGAKFDNPVDYAKVQDIAHQIMADIRVGQFDETLSRYGGNLKQIQANLDATQERLKELRQKQSKADMRDLWVKYRNFKAKSLARSTIVIDYDRRVGGILQKLPCTDLSEAIAIRDWIMEATTPSQARKILTHLSACCDWAIESQLIEVNPFTGMAQRIKVKPDSDSDINPFSIQERDQIIQAFKLSPQYSHYAPLVEFLFFTGCRPSEAIALTWEDFSKDKLTFDKAWVEGRLQKGLKTQKKRVIKLNFQALTILESEFSKVDENASGLIFPSPENTVIDWRNFAVRAWRSVLASLPEIDYRNPYQCRHTFITWRLMVGDKVQDIAKYCGNSSTMIYKRYAGITRGYCPD